LCKTGAERQRGMEEEEEGDGKMSVWRAESGAERKTRARARKGRERARERGGKGEGGRGGVGGKGSRREREKRGREGGPRDAVLEGAEEGEGEGEEGGGAVGWGGGKGGRSAWDNACSAHAARISRGQRVHCPEPRPQGHRPTEPIVPLLCSRRLIFVEFYYLQCVCAFLCAGTCIMRAYVGGGLTTAPGANV